MPISTPSTFGHVAPAVTVEIAFSTDPFANTPTWTDVSDYVAQADAPIQIERGRGDAQSAIQVGICSFVLNNDDKRFTPGYTGGPYGANVKVGKKVRVTLTHNSTTYRRFTGYISSFDMGWPGGVTQQNRVMVTCHDLLGYMEQVKLKNVVQHTYLNSGPVAFWPLDDARGSATAQETSGYRVKDLRRINYKSGGTLKFSGGESLRSLPDGSRALRCKSNRDDFGWAALGANISTQSAADSIGIGVWVNYDDTNEDYSTNLMTVGLSAGTYGALTIGQDTVGRVFAGNFNNTSLLTNTVRGPRIDDGGWHWVYATYSEVGNGVVTLYLDGEQIGTSTYGVGFPTIPATTDVTINGGRHSDGTKLGFAASNARFAYAGVWTDQNATAMDVEGLYEAGHRAWDSQDRTSARIGRLLSWMGFPSGDRTIETGLSHVRVADMKQMTAFEYVDECVRAEQGMFFVGGDGKAVFQSRSHRWDATSEATFTYHDPALRFTTDLDQFVNTVSVTHRRGEVRVSDRDSRATYGPRELVVETQLSTQEEARGIADYLLVLREDMLPRASEYAFDLLTEADTATRDDVLGLELGDLFTVSSLPTQAHASSYDVWVEGIRETISLTDWSVTYITTPDKGLGGYWTLGTTALNASPTLAY